MDVKELRLRDSSRRDTILIICGSHVGRPMVTLQMDGKWGPQHEQFLIKPDDVATLDINGFRYFVRVHSERLCDECGELPDSKEHAEAHAPTV